MMSDTIGGGCQTSERVGHLPFHDRIDRQDQEPEHTENADYHGPGLIDQSVALDLHFHVDFSVHFDQGRKGILCARSSLFVGGFCGGRFGEFWVKRCCQIFPLCAQ